MPEVILDTAPEHTNKRWHWALFALLVLFNLYQLLTHAMWRDELLAWSIARDSRSLAELYTNRSYEGFPLLWHLVLWVLTAASQSPLVMQLFHFACALTTQLLIMTRSPFSPGMRLAVVSGYYLSFEYCIISRAYVLGVLLITVYCAFQEQLSRHPALRGTVLGLLANSSVFGAILSLACAADELLSAVKGREEDTGSERPRSSGIVPFLAAYSSLLVAAVAAMLPPQDDTFAAGWNLNPDLLEKLYVLCRLLIAMVPVPVPRATFWNSLAALDAGMWLALPVSLAVLLAVWYTLRDAPRYLGLFTFGLIGVWIFSVVKYLGKVRHSGSVLILFIACSWLMFSALKRERRSPSPAAIAALWGILIANMAAFGIAAYYHLKYDFSGGRDMADIIRRSGGDAPIVGDIDYAASTVAGYLNRPIHFATSRSTGTFIIWNGERSDVGPSGVIDLAASLAVQHPRVLLLLNYPLESAHARFLACSADAIVADEVFHLYEFVR